MKTIWSVLSIIAVANMVAAALFLAFLALTDRLDTRRVHELKEVLATTIAQRSMAEQAEQDAAEPIDDAQAADDDIALSASELLELRIIQSEVDLQRKQRLAREIKDLQRAQSLAHQQLVDERAAFDAEVKAFRDELARLRAIDGSRQFKKAVKVLDGLAAEDAVAVLRAMIDGGGDPAMELASADGTAVGDAELGVDGMTRAVSYLNAMQERSRTRVVSTIAAEDPVLAAQLLEEIRKRGVTPR